jgi:hypothetical protein
MEGLKSLHQNIEKNPIAYVIVIFLSLENVVSLRSTIEANVAKLYDIFLL